MSRTRPNLTRYPQLNDAAWLHQRHVIEGANAAAIAREVGCTYPTAVKALARNGITPKIEPRSGRKWTPTKDELLAEYQDAGSLERLAADREVSLGTVRNTFSRLGLCPADYEPDRRAALPPELSDPEWLREAAYRNTTSAIADSLGVSIEVLREAVNRFGITTSRRTPQAVIDEAVQMYRHGSSLADVAAHVGLDKSGVFRWIQKAGVPTHALRPNPLPRQTEDRLRRRLRDAASKVPPPGHRSVTVRLRPEDVRHLLAILDETSIDGQGAA